MSDVLRAADALADELERPTGTESEVQALVDAYRAARDAAPAAPLLPGEIPAGSVQWRDGWVTGYEQAGLDARVIDHVRDAAPADEPPAVCDVTDGKLDEVYEAVGAPRDRSWPLVLAMIRAAVAARERFDRDAGESR